MASIWIVEYFISSFTLVVNMSKKSTQLPISKMSKQLPTYLHENFHNETNTLPNN